MTVSSNATVSCTATVSCNAALDALYYRVLRAGLGYSPDNTSTVSCDSVDLLPRILPPCTRYRHRRLLGPHGGLRADRRDTGSGPIRATCTTKPDAGGLTYTSESNAAGPRIRTSQMQPGRLYVRVGTESRQRQVDWCIVRTVSLNNTFQVDPSPTTGILLSPPTNSLPLHPPLSSLLFFLQFYTTSLPWWVASQQPTQPRTSGLVACAAMSSLRSHELVA